MRSPSPFPARLAVSDRAATALLIDERARRFLGPFLGQACGVSEAARQLGVGRSLVSYWVGRLHAAGLLVPAQGGESRHRAWRASADAYVVSLADLPLDSDSAILSAHMDPAHERIKQALLRVARREASYWQFMVSGSPQGVRHMIAPRTGNLLDAKLLNNRANIYLSDEQAASLRAELLATLERFTLMSVQGRGRKRHSVWVCAVEDLP